jgi:hypothetical protein
MIKKEEGLFKEWKKERLSYVCDGNDQQGNFKN